MRGPFEAPIGGHPLAVLAEAPRPTFQAPGRWSSMVAIDRSDRPRRKGRLPVLACGAGAMAYLLPDGSRGWSNAGLIVDGDRTLLVDTLFDLKLTAEMLDSMRRSIPAAARIGTLVNTHHNGDHTFGNQLVEGAEIIPTNATKLGLTG
jgi:glyoxylase-like metal-dependent hydrolase (beta-lactamase superfamily II)